MKHRIGFIADVQYADIDDVWNFLKTHKRRYRSTIVALRNAIDFWSRTENIDLVVDLGDAIDGFRNTNRDMGMHALTHIMDAWKRYTSNQPTVPIVRLVGNHELYKFTREELINGVGETGFRCSRPPNLSTPVDMENSLYYSFKLREDSEWRIIVLDPYEQSVMRNGGGRVGHELTLDNGGLDRKYTELCQKHNPNDILEASDYFKDLTGVQSRWAPFNGGIEANQLEWLEQTLSLSQRNEDKVIVLCHVILHPRATPRENCHTLLWNYEEVLSVFSKYNCVKLCLYGHAHQEGYFRCPDTGTHHITIASPLESPVGEAEQTFGILEIAEDGETAYIRGHGMVASRCLPLI
jgi:manganese-dependent ADP-ribose/CDP-alcohol diphosphatase